MNASQLIKFVKSEQGEALSEEEAKDLIEKCELSTAKSKTMLTLSGEWLFAHL